MTLGKCQFHRTEFLFMYARANATAVWITILIIKEILTLVFESLMFSIRLDQNLKTEKILHDIV